MTKHQDALHPIIPLRDVVVFPEARIPFVVGRPSSVEAVRAAGAGRGDVLLVMQREATVKEPQPADLHSIGTLGRIVHQVALPDGNLKLLVEGRQRCRLGEVRTEGSHLVASVTVADEPPSAQPARELAVTRLRAAWDAYCRARPALPPEPIASLLSDDDLGRATDEMAARLPLAAGEKQGLLETIDPIARSARLEFLLQLDEDREKLEQRLQKQVQKQVEHAQREYLLNEKLKAIQKELGRKADAADTDQLLERIDGAGMSPEAKERAIAEVHRLEAMPPASAEGSVVRAYLDWLIGMPWKKRSKERRDFERARRILEEDHHGLEKVKERILEFLAVRSLKKGPARGSILCLVGPPGVGKTSLGRSIARATGREFVRLSLGGVRDEAEIRGHRRTYIGAYPGRIVQMIHRAGTKNPVFVLDELDKLASDFRGDPASALLEVLDPEQNRAFLDHYLDIGFDLSEIMFVCTANVAEGIPAALRDRLEIIRIAGYTLHEKVAIAERFLVPKQREAHGLAERHLAVSREGIEAIIEGWTREAGVRALERELGSICRKVAMRVVQDASATVDLRSREDAQALLGVPRFRKAEAEREAEIGLATGLAWTEMGGQILLVEAVRMKGRGKIHVTGSLGDVMQESMQAALSYLRSRAGSLGLPDDALEGHDVHVHVPEGGIPKDGPSAGITMATALASALTGRKVRNDLAMTGEITLRGRVLPIGGLKEKVLAAHRLGIRRVLLPAENARDLQEIPADVRAEMTLELVSTMDDVLAAALMPEESGDGAVPPHLLAAGGAAEAAARP